jgi:hypothetical protein
MFTLAYIILEYLKHFHKSRKENIILINKNNTDNFNTNYITMDK